MKKRRIVIASVLKPLDDTRMFEKMGSSLASIDDYEIFIIGQAVKSIPAHPSIQFLPLHSVKRLSLSRLLLPIKIGLKLFQLKPQLLIVNSHELLIVSIANRILFGTRIIYDLRENYYRNIKFSEAFPKWLGALLALWVRLKEKLTAPLFHHFILAEKAYQNELVFVKNRFIILENKAAEGCNRTATPGQLDLLFSGTIAHSTGVFKAISLAHSLHQLDNRVKLTIMGYCALDKTQAHLRSAVKDKPYIQLKGIDHLVPHQEIMEEISKANFGIIHYPYSPHTSGSLPTKLYEYMTCQLPIITWADQSFAPLIKQHKAGIIVNDEYGLILKATEKDFYPKPIDGLIWDGPKFARLVEKLLR